MRQTFGCNDCNYPRTKKQKLIRHMKRVHMKIKDFKCEQCGYTCSKKQYLDRHIKHVPIQIKGFIFYRTDSSLEKMYKPPSNTSLPRIQAAGNFEKISTSRGLFARFYGIYDLTNFSSFELPNFFILQYNCSYT